MLNGLCSAASGMLAQQTRMDMLANDLANIDTYSSNTGAINREIGVGVQVTPSSGSRTG
jgi:flagellar basal body rod protein FlgG